MPVTPTVTALGPDLYAGTAGVALFLAELFARTGLEEARVTAHGAIRHALWSFDLSRDRLPIGFYSGLVGIAYSAARVGNLTDNHQLTDEGLRRAGQAISSQAGADLLDVMTGIAGAIAPLLQLANLPGGDHLAAPAVVLADQLAAAATKSDGVWSWESDRACGEGVGVTPLCGMAHGASGMGLALIEAGTRFQRRDLIEGGLAAFAYEDRLYDREHENWPDLRELRPGVDASPALRRTPFMVAWCHGAAGIGLARLRASRLLPSQRDDLRCGVERAVDASLRHLGTVGTNADASPCHGRAGAAETLLYTAEVLGDHTYDEQVVGMWIEVLRAREPDAPWPCGVASGRNNPSLMLGHAGIGYGLLRAADPAVTPSVLVIEGSDRG
jgi:lantibiotic modifying enzyme